MGQYGDAACLAVDMIREGRPGDPERAWKRAVRKVTKSSESQNKPCPKAAFLGLCAAGAIQEVHGSRTHLFSDNARYTLTALDGLRRNPNLANDRKALWTFATAGSSKSEQGQLDVLLGLWHSGKIVAE